MNLSRVTELQGVSLNGEFTPPAAQSSGAIGRGNEAQQRSCLGVRTVRNIVTAFDRPDILYYGGALKNSFSKVKKKIPTSQIMA